MQFYTCDNFGVSLPHTILRFYLPNARTGQDIIRFSAGRWNFVMLCISVLHGRYALPAVAQLYGVATHEPLTIYYVSLRLTEPFAISSQPPPVFQVLLPPGLIAIARFYPCPLDGGQAPLDHHIPFYKQLTA